MTDQTSRIQAAIREQGKWCGDLGSPITAQLCETLASIIVPLTATERRLLAWEDDLVKSAFVLRITGAFHALARDDSEPALSALYRGENGDWPLIIRDVLNRRDAWLRPWLDSPPQTNEVGRAAVLWAGLIAVAARFDQPMELLELGSSAGLNLNLDKFAYDLGGVKSGDPESPVQLKPEWTGPSPPATNPIIAARRGVDLMPVDVTDPSSAERLIAYIWAGQTERLARTANAIAIAQAHPPVIDRADIVGWLGDRLSANQQEGVTRVVMHSITLQYLTPEAREEVAVMMTEAGGHATPSKPLAWVSMEIGDIKHTPALQVTTWGSDEVHFAAIHSSMLRISVWPDGAPQVLANVHPHGATIKWVVN
jgi:hypothetical protein